MIEPVFFDADLLSSFFWTGKQYLLIRLYKDRIFIPERVIYELNRVSQLKKILDSLSAQKQICKAEILIGTPEFELYNKLISKPEPRYKVIGQGEAAAISLAKCRNGILGSNNLKDITQYITLYKIKYITTASILEDLYNQGIITEKEGNSIWYDMIVRRTILPYTTFSDYLKFRKVQK
jgi:hypothetical protein